MIVNWTDNALKHLDKIYEYIAHDSEYYAQMMMDRLTSRSIQISSFPRSGRTVPEYEHEYIREVIESSYRIVYHFDEEDQRIDVLGVFHCAQLLPQK